MGISFLLVVSRFRVLLRSVLTGLRLLVLAIAHLRQYGPLCHEVSFLLWTAESKILRNTIWIWSTLVRHSWVPIGHTLLCFLMMHSKRYLVKGGDFGRHKRDRIFLNFFVLGFHAMLSQFRWKSNLLRTLTKLLYSCSYGKTVAIWLISR